MPIESDNLCPVCKQRRIDTVTDGLRTCYECYHSKTTKCKRCELFHFNGVDNLCNRCTVSDFIDRESNWHNISSSIRTMIIEMSYQLSLQFPNIDDGLVESEFIKSVGLDRNYCG